MGRGERGGGVRGGGGEDPRAGGGHRHCRGRGGRRSRLSLRGHRRGRGRLIRGHGRAEEIAQLYVFGCVVRPERLDCGKDNYCENRSAILIRVHGSFHTQDGCKMQHLSRLTIYHEIGYLTRPFSGRKREFGAIRGRRGLTAGNGEKQLRFLGFLLLTPVLPFTLCAFAPLCPSQYGDLVCEPV